MHLFVKENRLVKFLNNDLGFDVNLRIFKNSAVFNKVKCEKLYTDENN